MGGGGGHGDAHYPGYPTGVWSPTGGWWCDPKLWRRNTAITLAGIFIVCVPIAMKSAQLEALQEAVHYLAGGSYTEGCRISYNNCAERKKGPRYRESMHIYKVARGKRTPPVPF